MSEVLGSETRAFGSNKRDQKRAGLLSSDLEGNVGLFPAQIWELQVPCSPRFTFDDFLSNPTKVRDWNIQGLPSDAFSTENGIIVTRGNR